MGILTGDSVVKGFGRILVNQFKVLTYFSSSYSTPFYVDEGPKKMIGGQLRGSFL
ncbi:hypothetical protein HanXRQr2_Chr16g0725371 [Helianthus annuus]|uniref:Uncharacterized protein n=1 Tax=Helianthus annuus TaxID=4232 RepID=A0A9K3DM19_HELAN|nr:hypothetical protein HanXRQr2_Chr16g0725371 [Helianthus annuus]